MKSKTFVSLCMITLDMHVQTCPRARFQTEFSDQTARQLFRSGDCICPMKTVTLRRSDIFRTHVLHVYTYPGVFTGIF